MSGSKDDLPEFIREALAEGDDASLLDVTAVPGLHELLPPEDAALGRDRLLAAVDELPWRYAPFFARMAELWDLPEDDVVQVLEKAREPDAWRNPGLRGLRLIDVQGGEKTAGAELHLVRFEKGMRFPMHRHPGPEALLVLEGCYTDSLGRYVGPGDLHVMEPGTQHSFRVGKDEPCIAASRQFGREFTGPLMRLLVKLRG